jgi:rhodanese-related sulfurtransferase
MDALLDTTVETETAELPADVQEDVGRSGTIKSISPVDAWRLLRERPEAILVDVRSSAEFLFVGHPQGAVHVPWMDEPDWVVNGNFAEQIAATVSSLRPGVSRDRVPVLLLCRSGKRSLEAAQTVIDQGYADIYNVSTGFEGDLDDHHHRSTVNGWRFEGLPWEQC